MVKSLLRARRLAALALLAFLVSGWMASGWPVAEAQHPKLHPERSRRIVKGWQSAPTETPLPTETKINIATATYDPLTPTVTPFPATPTKSGDGGVGDLGLVQQFYLPLISRSEEVILPPTATPTTTPLPTLTAPAPPPAALSRYMTTDNIDSTDYDALFSLGRKRGGCDGGPPAHHDSLLILAFGYPWDNHTSTSAASLYGVALYPSGHLTATLTQLESNMIGFFRGYYNCVSSTNPSASLTVGLGINSSVSTGLTAEHGRQWAQLVDDLNDWIKTPPSWADKLHVAGAADFEPGWGSKIASVRLVRQWVDGYAGYVGANPPNQYYFYGSCDGCPYVTRDASGNFVASYAPVLVSESDWTMDDVWYVSYGADPAWPVPEIYATNGNHARQWQNLALWAATCNLIPYTTTQCEPQRRSINRYMRFAGAMTQHQACLDNTPPCDPSLMNWPSDGWRQLWQALNDPNTPLTHQGALEWITDIAWKQ